MFLYCNADFHLSVAVYKRSTIPVFKAHGLAQASMADCATETFSAIRTVSLRYSATCIITKFDFPDLLEFFLLVLLRYEDVITGEILWW